MPVLLQSTFLTSGLNQHKLEQNDYSAQKLTHEDGPECKECQVVSHELQKTKQASETLCFRGVEHFW